MTSTFRTRLLASSLLIGAAALASPAHAQDAPEPPIDAPGPDPVAVPADADDTDPTVPSTSPVAAEGDVIIVTGSRIRQDSFNSPTPIQVLDADQAARLGVTSASELLQRSTVASGQQIDASLNTSSGNSNATEAPPTGGAGASNIDLRGMGVERTLVLVNGRRLGAAGVRGAPAQPDIGLLPLGMIERIDVVTEGASSIYGADAVAGVVNVILKTDFEGLEAFGHIERPEHGGGDVEQISAIIGTSGDRARIMAGAEYYKRDRVKAFQRSFTAGGLRTIEEGEDGTIYSVFANPFLENMVITDSSQFFLFTPGQSDTGVPNWSTGANLPPVPPNSRDIGPGSFSNFRYFPFYSDNGDRLNADLVQPLERFSFVTSGSYDLNVENNMKAYFEGYYFERRQRIEAANEQIAPTIPALIPQLDADGRTVDFVDNPLNPFDEDVSLIITMEDLPQHFDVNVQQIRVVGGVSGDLPGEFFRQRGWNYDVSWSYDKGTGFQSQGILFEPHLFNVVEGVFRDAEGNLRCGPVERADNLDQLTLPPCPIVNFFNPVFFTGGVTGEGVFENDAQRDYLRGNRTNRTVIEQTIYSAFISGDLFENPYGGTVRFAAGYEHRDDVIDSQNSLVGVMGLNAAENPLTEGETIGGRNLDEIYAEVQVPLLRNRPFAELLQVDGAARYTHESNFGGETTYRARGLWRPVNWIQLSGSYGTSYRAPNLREQFLAAQGGGIPGTADPCRNPPIQIAIAEVGDTDPAIQHLIQNCIASGVVFFDTDGNGVPDTTDLGTAVISTIPITTGGNEELLPETSRSYTATLSVSPPIFGPANIDLAVSYYNIRINNSVRNLGGDVIISQCFTNSSFPNLTSPFCDLITRDQNAPPIQREIQLVEAGFVNIGEETVQGIDFNARLSTGLKDMAAWMPDAVLRIAGTLTHQWEREVQTFGADDRQDFSGSFGFPKWKGQVTAAVETGPWQLTTQVNYIGKQRAINFDSAVFNFDVTPVFVLPDGTRPIARPMGRAGEEWYQDLSLTYEQDTFSITGGIQNLWDNEPPLIDRIGGPNRLNAVSSTGYDFIGRTFFLNGRVKF